MTSARQMEQRSPAMREYLVSDLTEAQTSQIENELKKRGWAASLEHMFWLPLPECALSSVQKSHCPKCAPYVAAVEVEPNCLRAELLVRSQSSLHCECIAYAEPDQVAYTMNELHSILQGLNISC